MVTKHVFVKMMMMMMMMMRFSFSVAYATYIPMLLLPLIWEERLVHLGKTGGWSTGVYP